MIMHTFRREIITIKGNKILDTVLVAVVVLV